MADGHRVRTVEDLARGRPSSTRCRRASPSATGCSAGSARPGMMMTARWLLDHNPDPTAGRDPRGALRADLPVHRLREHRAVRAVGQRARGERGRRGGRMTTGREPATTGPVGLRAGPAQGGRPLRPRPGHLRRRHPAARDAARRDPAQPARARPDRLDRHLGRRGPPEGQGRHHRRDAGRRAAWPGCRRCPRTCRRCWPPTRSGSRARRWRSSSPRTGTRPGTRSS